MKKIITFIALAILTFTITGCFSFEEVSWMEFVDSFDSVYEVGETIDLSKIKVRVGFTDGKIQVFAANSSELTVSDVNTTTAGIKTVRITYRTLSVTAQYEVVDTNAEGAIKVSDAADFEDAIADSTISTIYVVGVINSNKTYAITRALSIIGLKGASINNSIFNLDSSIGTGIIVFKNLILNDVDSKLSHVIRVGSAAFPGKIHIDGCEISNYNIAVDIYSSAAGAAISELKITNSFFNNNRSKGVYTENGNNIVISGTTFNSNATLGNTTPPIALDINLKYRAYNSVLVENCRFVGNGTEYMPEQGYFGGPGYTITNFTAALAIKARNDGNYAADPAILNNITIRNNFFENNFYAIYLGEPLSYTENDKKYAVPGLGVLNNISLYGNVFENNKHANIINATTNVLIPSEVMTERGLSDALVYSSLTPGVKIINYSGVTPNYSAYQESALSDKNVANVRSFANVTVINKSK